MRDQIDNYPLHDMGNRPLNKVYIFGQKHFFIR